MPQMPEIDARNAQHQCTGYLTASLFSALMVGQAVDFRIHHATTRIRP